MYKPAINIIIPEMILIYIEYLINLLKLIFDAASATANMVSENPLVNKTRFKVL